MALFSINTAAETSKDVAEKLEMVMIMIIM
jgi:hypothetical protein